MAKGGDFERYIAKMLGMWWTNNERDDIFWRTSGSGARATSRRKVGKSTCNQDGDLCAIDPVGQPLIDKTTIELKVGYNGWTIKELIDSKPSRKETILEQFFSQANREAVSQNKPCWWLITKQDRRECVVFVNHPFWKWMRQVTKLAPNFVFVSISHKEFGQVYACRLADFLVFLKPEVFK